MTFRDFNDEGPGTFEWDYVLGGNTTGLFPEETHFNPESPDLFSRKRRLVLILQYLILLIVI